MADDLKNEIEKKKEIRQSFSVFGSALKFIKNNPSIILSLALIIVLPLVLYFNTYFILYSFEKTSENEFLRKAAMTENAIDAMIDQDLLEDKEKINAKIKKLKEKENEILNLEILLPKDEKRESYLIAASFFPDRIGKEVPDDTFKNIAWSQSEGTAHREKINSDRILVTEKTLHDSDGNRIGLASLSFSMQTTDELISQTFKKSYYILAISIFIVFLFIFNHTRIFNYAVRFSKLKEIDEMKDNFISVASHELRSPLTAMRAYLSFFQEKEAGNISEKGKEYIANLEISVNRLDRLVEDILEVSRLEQNRIPFDMQIIDPEEVIAGSIKEMKSKADEKGLEIEYKEAELPKIKADAERLKQILVNLISNAIKYTPSGKIEISTKDRYKTLDIIIADTGLGISAENQKSLFQKFFRAQNKKTSNVPGTGLGLWITRELARKMNGDITVESIEGVGSHFTASFPIVKE